MQTDPLPGLTLDEYRAKWRLPADCPIIAPNYVVPDRTGSHRHDLRKIRKSRRSIAHPAAGFRWEFTSSNNPPLRVSHGLACC
ncbi:MAG: hypothetical protein E5X07_30640 [Mesorhizobium sp.]|nr:MAG: hypothetical protein E5X07_30640 [Mesorhizobium sp.]